MEFAQDRFLTVDDICVKLGRNKGGVAKRLRKLGIKKVRARDKSGSERFVKAVEMWDAGYSAYQIAETLGYSSATSVEKMVRSYSAGPADLGNSYDWARRNWEKARKGAQEALRQS